MLEEFIPPKFRFGGFISAGRLIAVVLLVPRVGVVPGGIF
jgi:hypothetical protein